MGAPSSPSPACACRSPAIPWSDRRRRRFGVPAPMVAVLRAQRLAEHLHGLLDDSGERNHVDHSAPPVREGMIQREHLATQARLKGHRAFANVAQLCLGTREQLPAEHRRIALGTASRPDQMLMQQLPVALIGPVAGVCVEFSDHPWPRVGSGRRIETRPRPRAIEITMRLDAPATAQSIRLTHGLPPVGPVDTTASSFAGQGAAQRSYRLPPLPSACNIRPLRLSGSILSNDE